MRRAQKAALAVVALLVAAGPAGPAQAGVRAAGAGPAITVDATTDRHAIDPHVYGMNFPDEALAQELRLPLARWGGNATTRYNYKLDTYNAGSDWFFENLQYNNDVSALPDGSQADKFVEQNRRTGTDSLLTVPMIGYTAGARDDSCGFSVTKYGPQASTDQWRPDCGNGVKSDGTDVTGNDPADTSTPIGPDFTKGWVQYLDSTYGTAGAGGVRYYDLDNEPDLWHATHRDVHPTGASDDELRDSTYATAAAIKDADPDAQTLGPVGWGFNSLIYSGLDQDTCNREGGSCWSNPPDQAAHGGLQFAPWYLQQMKAYEQAHGQRILDYFDEHIYPQQSGVALGDTDDAATQALRLRSTRQLWDPSYVDESWINQPIQFIPRMRSLVDQNYPGTKLAISEYNWGALDHIDGALAQADVLGIFGREGLDLATLWSPPKSTDPGAYAFRMFRDYDGNGGSFGDTSVHAASADQDQLAVYAAERSSDHALTVMVINKTTGDLTAPVSLTGSGSLPSAAQVYRYGQADLTSIQHPADQPVTDGGFTATFPAYSITEYVLPPGTAGATPPSAPGTPVASAVGSDRATLGWTAAAAGSAPVSGYEVYSGDPATSAPVAEVAAPATSATVTGLTPSTAYSFRVVAKDSSGRSSPPSSPVQVTTAAGSAAQCTVAYSVSNDWGSGFSANTTVTNLGAATSSWQLGFTFTGNQQVSQGWNGTWSQSGTKVTVDDAGWNGALATGASTTVGFNASYSGSNPAPGNFTLNGHTCTTAATAALPAAVGRAPGRHAVR
jgi:Glycoside hydrolase family 44/Cellulose binding domain/Fibronectin type III domain